VLAQVAAKQRLGVNSCHHQAVAKVAKFLRPTAESIDGIIEGLELAPAAAGMLPYLMAVQFHPERLFTRHAEHLELFRSFTRACCRGR
jgi:putative glutamine amidotransferase